MKRAIFDIVLFLSIFLLPWWVSVALALAGIFLFIEFYEFLAVGILIYSIYIIPAGAFLTKPIWFALALALLYIAIQALRRSLIVYTS